MKSERQRTEFTLKKELHNMAFPSVYGVHQSHAHSPSVSLILSASVWLVLGTISNFCLKKGNKICGVCKLKSQEDYLHI